MNKKQQLKELYSFDFPEDFWTFCEFWKEIKDEDLLDDFCNEVAMVPFGPLEVLQGEFEGREILLPIWMHFRYRFDPPEFLTVFCGDSDGLHWGYWSDNPVEGKFVVASYYARDAYQINDEGNTLLEAVRKQLEYQVVGNLELIENDPNYEDVYKQNLLKLDKIREILIKHETSDRKETGEKYVDKYKGSNRQMIAQTCDGMGIVVEKTLYNPELGYIHIRTKEQTIESRRIALKAIEDGFPGNALQIGKELWWAGDEFLEETKLVLGSAYEALGRNLLKEIMLTHLEYKDNSSVDITDFVGKEFKSLETALQNPLEVIVLRLRNKQLNTFPAEIRQFSNLKILDLIENEFTELPEWICELKNLIRIHLSTNKLKRIPDGIGQLKNLKTLIISSNPISDIPEAVFELKSLKELYLYKTNIDKKRLKEIEDKMPGTNVYYNI